jgi:arylsulfatase A-like enzyme
MGKIANCSPPRPYQAVSSRNLFFYLLLLTTVFLLGEISFFIQCTQIYFHDFRFISNHLAIPLTIFPGIVFFIGAHLLVHLIYTLLIWLASLLVASIFSDSIATTLKIGVGLWLVGIITVFIANEYFFPNSKFSELSRFFIPEFLAPGALYVLSSFWGLVLLMLPYFLWTRVKTWRRFVFFIFTGSVLAYFYYQNFLYVPIDASTQEKPNIIIIGVDSLRPDFLGVTGTPVPRFFPAFLEQATVFSNAFTPLARTFPSWVGILSGLFPKESGIRFNLATQENIKKLPLLSTILHKQGYRTIYATDETQFSNIDKNFGFDEALTPPMGLNDFLLGSFNDFPLSNLLINTVVGKWLFPHSYANRPTFMTYSPASFLSLLRPYLQESRQQPLFLAVHFCLTHYPYLWRAHSGLNDTQALSRYQAAIVGVDQQLNDFMAMLKRYQLLRHAIVVLLSDHGEALELQGDRITSPLSYVPLLDGTATSIPRFYPPSADKEAVNQSAGHGTDVLGFSQYHTLLAVRLYGLGKQALKTYSPYVMLLDIKPTILDFLNIPNKSSGVSLKGIIRGESNNLSRHTGFFLESDFSPQAVRSVHPETRNLIFEGIELFSIDPQTTRVIVKEKMGNLIISSKQYAIIDQNWVLALYPQEQEKMIPVLVHLPSGKWTTNLRTAFAQQSPQKRMLQALKQFYGKEIKQVLTGNR